MDAAEEDAAGGREEEFRSSSRAARSGGRRPGRNGGHRTTPAERGGLGSAGGTAGPPAPARGVGGGGGDGDGGGLPVAVDFTVACHRRGAAEKMRVLARGGVRGKRGGCLGCNDKNEVSF